MKNLELTGLHPPSAMSGVGCNYSRVQLPQGSPAQLNSNGSSEESSVRKGKKGERRKEERERGGLMNHCQWCRRMVVMEPMIQRKERRKPMHKEKGEESRFEEGKQPSKWPSFYSL